MAESLAVHVKTYCTLSTLSAEAEAALGSILASLQGGAGDGGKLSLLQLIDSSQEVLTSTDDGVRNRGIMMLGEVLTIKQVGGALAAQKAPSQNIIAVVDKAAADGASHLGETRTCQRTSFAQAL